MTTATHSAVDLFTAGWRERPVTIVSTAGHLPVKTFSDTVGLYFRGEVFIVDGQEPQRVAQLLGHELVAHHGLRVLFGRDRWLGFMSAVAAGARGGDAALARAQADVRSVYRDARGDLYLSPLLEADETCARLAELLHDPMLGPLIAPRPIRLRMQALAGAFCRDVLLLNRPATGAEVRGALLHAGDHLRRGRPFWARLAWWYSGWMSKPMGAKIPPRSLAESEALLKADQDWKDSKTGFKFGAQFIIGGLILLACLIGLTIGLVQVFSR